MKATLITVFGIPGAGKSMLSRGIAAELGLPLFDTDSPATILWRELDLEPTKALDIAFKICVSLACTQLRLFNSAVLCGALAQPDRWRQLEAAVLEEATLLPVFLNCSVPTALARLETRQGIWPPTHVIYHTEDTLPRIAQDVHARRDELVPSIVIDGEREPDSVLSVALARLTQEL